MQNKTYNKIKKKVDIKKLLTSTNEFKDIKSELFKEDIYKKMSTLCFDVLNIFVRKVNLEDIEELNKL